MAHSVLSQAICGVHAQNRTRILVTHNQEVRPPTCIWALLCEPQRIRLCYLLCPVHNQKRTTCPSTFQALKFADFVLLLKEGHLEYFGSALDFPNIEHDAEWKERSKDDHPTLSALSSINEDGQDVRKSSDLETSDPGIDEEARAEGSVRVKVYL